MYIFEVSSNFCGGLIKEFNSYIEAIRFVNNYESFDGVDEELVIHRRNPETDEVCEWIEGRWVSIDAKAFEWLEEIQEVNKKHGRKAAILFACKPSDEF
jgi:hypothetical protein